MMQKLLLLFISFFSSLNQNKFSSTAKWFCLTFLMFQMGYGQTGCNVVKGGDFPNAASVTTNWGVLTSLTTGWYYEATYAAGKIYIDANGVPSTVPAVTGKLSQNLTGLLGNSLTVSFDLTGQNADRFACGTTAMLDVKVGGVTYMTITNPVGNTTITQNDVQTFNGATFGPTNFSILVGANGTLNQTTGVKSGGLPAASLGVVTITMTIPSWTGGTSALLEFAARTPNKTTAETGNCRDTSGADDWILDNISVIASSPTAYTITGDDTCNSPTTIGLPNSQLGVNYQLYRGGTTPVGSSVAGTGAPISFGSQNTVGVYTVVATAGTTSCTTTMTNSVSINSLPTAPTASAQSFCTGATVASLVATAPTSGIVVDWYSASSGGTALATTAVLSSGTYYAQSRNTTTGCVSATRTSIAVTINPLPVAPTTSAQSFCAGSTVASLVATAPTSGSVVDWYSASSGGTALATTTVLSSATYYAQSRNTTTGCVSSTRTSAVITINSNPTISTAATTGVVTAVCQSASAQTTTMDYTATTFLPTSYSIDWASLADQGSTAFSFAAGGGTLTGITIPAGATSGTYTGTMTVTNANGCIGTKAVTLTINPILTAGISISASSGTVCAGTNVTFTATPTNPGTTPVYQWKLNGVNVGSNSTTYTNSTLLLNNDVVTCEMTSNASPCLTGSPATSNAITVASSGPTLTGVTICAGGSGSLSSSINCSSNTAGPKDAGAGATSGGAGDAWSNTGRIISNNDSYVNCDVSPLSSSENFLATNYGFSIPTGATINGIQVMIGRYGEDAVSLTDNSVRLLVGGTATGTDKKLTGNWPATKTVATYGSATDLWGATLTPAIINNANFGVLLDVNNSNSIDRRAYVDYIQIIVTYSISSTLDWYTVSSGGSAVESGNTFNPVNDPQVIAQGGIYSSLNNSNTPGTYTFYAACSTNSTCRTPVTFVIRETPTATISGTTTVCQGGTSPNITFTNPRSLPITVNYAVNGTNASVNVPANNTATVAVPTGISGTFTYNLVSAVYQTAPTCSAPLSNSAVVTVTSTVGTPTSITVSAGSEPTCQLSNGTTTTTYATTATNYTGFNWSISNASAGSINATTGVMTWANGFSGSVDIRVTASGCNGPSSQVVRTVTITPTVGTPTAITVSAGSEPTCQLTNGTTTTTYSTTATNNTGFNWSLSSSSAGSINATTGVMTWVNGFSGSVDIRVTANGCNGPSAQVVRSVTVNSRPIITVGTVTNINCTTNTGSVVLNDLPTTGGNWTITSTPATASVTGSGNTTTISGLTSGSYTFTVTNASGCPSPASALVTISDFSSTTWNGSGWSTGAPNATTNVIVSSVTPSSPFTADLVACALTINSGVVATVPSGITLTITNAVTVNGSLTFENNSSLVQINDVPNTGAIVYKRISQPMVNFDYTYWSSPVVGQTLFNLSPNTLSDKYHSFTGTAWKVINRGAAVMQPGIGYIIRTPKAGTWPAPYAETVVFPYSQPVQFRGVPTNGTFRSSETMVAGNFYLVGNPYPCALDADEFLFLNTHNRAILEGTIYLWTHNSAIKSSGSKYIYVSDDYASYNLTGGTATSESAPSASNPGAVNTNAPSGYIAAGQSFFVTAEAPGNIEFTNLMRAGGANNGQFFKPGKTSKSKLEKHRLWLKMINSGGAYKQALIGYIEGATNSFDKSFDGLSFDGNSYIDFYSITESGNYVIQGRALPFNDTDIVPLGYRSTVAGDFTIAIDHADGNLATQRIFLEDKQTGTVSELTAGNYTFNTKAGTFNNRFVLKYTNNRTLGTGDFETVDNSVSIVAQNKMITVNSTKDNLEKVFIYDVAGKQLYSKDNVNDLQLIMQNLPFAQQVLLIKIVLENGMVTTKKVVFK